MAKANVETRPEDMLVNRKVVVMCWLMGAWPLATNCLRSLTTVNYLDLSRLGNEGETPNSDEIWVTVEDDNKFLTSDTETYSVATDNTNIITDHIKGI